MLLDMSVLGSVSWTINFFGLPLLLASKHYHVLFLQRHLSNLMKPNYINSM